MIHARARILVTGATGFLGGALVRRLHQDGYPVRASGRNLEKGAQLEALGIEFIKADLSNPSEVDLICKDMDIVIHSGAFSSLWGSPDDFWTSNVEGTRHMVEAILKHKVNRLIHISSPSVYFDFKDNENIREEASLPSRFVNEYTYSKYKAEEEVLKGVEKGLSCLILRPRALYGPGDTAIFPRILRTLESARLKVIGSGENLADLTYIDNAVEACLCALSVPIPQSGRIYNITDGTPLPLWPLLNQMAHQLGYPPPQKKVPLSIARFAARFLERFHRLFRPHVEPLFTEYSVGILGYSLTLNIDRARIELGYKPKVTSQEGIQALLQWWNASNQKRESVSSSTLEPPLAPSSTPPSPLH